MNFDPLGFTRQTEMVLRGVGAQDLIKEFKNRNISTNQLHRLTKEDLVILGNLFTLTVFYFFMIFLCRNV